MSKPNLLVHCKEKQIKSSIHILLTWCYWSCSGSSPANLWRVELSPAQINLVCIMAWKWWSDSRCSGNMAVRNSPTASCPRWNPRRDREWALTKSWMRHRIRSIESSAHFPRLPPTLGEMNRVRSRSRFRPGIWIECGRNGQSHIELERRPRRRLGIAQVSSD